MNKELKPKKILLEKIYLDSGEYNIFKNESIYLDDFIKELKRIENIIKLKYKEKNTVIPEVKLIYNNINKNIVINFYTYETYNEMKERIKHYKQMKKKELDEKYKKDLIELFGSDYKEKMD